MIGKTEVSWFSGDEQPHQLVDVGAFSCDYPLFLGDEQHDISRCHRHYCCDYPLFLGDEQLVFAKCLFLKTDVATRPLRNE